MYEPVKTSDQGLPGPPGRYALHCRDPGGRKWIALVADGIDPRRYRGVVLSTLDAGRGMFGCGPSLHLLRRINMAAVRGQTEPSLGTAASIHPAASSLASIYL